MKKENTEFRIVDSFVDTELEDSIIGGCLSAGRDAVGELIRADVKAEHFTQESAARAYRALMDTYESGIDIDLVTVSDRVRETKGLAREELVYMAGTLRSSHFGAHLTSHCEILKKLYVKRMTRDYSQRLLHTALQSEQTEILVRMHEFSDELMSLRHSGDVEPLGAYYVEFEKELSERMLRARTGELAGISTGLQNLNGLTNGWRNSTLNIIAGRPGMGKSALAIHFALSAARAGKSVCIFSLEMSRKQITERIVMALAEGMDNDAIRRGTPSERDMEACSRARDILATLPLTVLDIPQCTTAFIRAEAQRLRKQGRCDMVVIDYLQLTEMAEGTNRNYNREQQVAKASREYKILSRELDIPVLLLSQLSRAVESRGDKKPMLSDLRESGSIEQDADTVTFVYRPEYYKEDGYVTYDGYGNFDHGTAFAIVAKQREGPTGEVEFCYDRTLSKIWDGESRHPNPAVNTVQHPSAQPPAPVFAEPPQTQRGDDGTAYTQFDFPY